MRILYLVNAFEPDAPTRLCLEVARAASAAGHDVRLIAWARDGNLAVSLQQAGIAHEYLHGSPTAFFKALKRFKPNIVQTILTRPTILGAPIAKLAGIPTVIAVHHGSHEWEEKGKALGTLLPAAYRLAGAAVAKFVTVSEAAAKELRSVHIPSGRIHVIPNGVDAMRFVPRTNTARAGDSETKIVVGSIGNLRPVKGMETFIDAASILQKSHPHLRFAVWGDGPLRAELQARIDRNQLTDVFKLYGHTDSPLACFHSLDIYVQSSRNESFGLAAAEAMACGLPVIVSSVGGLPELVGSAGILVERDAAKLAAAIASLADNDAVRGEIGIAARNRILDHFSVQKMTDNYLALYHDVATRNAAT